jgi:hypothetical protein
VRWDAVEARVTVVERGQWAGHVVGQRAGGGHVYAEVSTAGPQRLSDAAQHKVRTSLVVYGVEGGDEVVLLRAVQLGGIPLDEGGVGEALT